MRLKTRPVTNLTNKEQDSQESIQKRPSSYLLDVLHLEDTPANRVLVDREEPTKTKKIQLPKGSSSSPSPVKTR